MQFGRISGIALIVLGIVLCSLQAVLLVTPKKDRQAPETTTTAAEHRPSSLPGLVGAGSLIAGIAILATGRRRDEPDQKYAVK